MEKYIVIDFFRWGNLLLNKGQTLLIEKVDARTVRVSVDGDPDGKPEIVSGKAVDTMIMLNKIEKKP